jgi:hypothetical protein
MPFRTIDPDEADQLATVQARREASRQRVAAGKRIRTAQAKPRPLRERKQISEAEMTAWRCKNRLEHAASGGNSLLLAVFLGALFLVGPVVGIGVLLNLVAEGPSWAHIGIGVAAVAWVGLFHHCSELLSTRRLQRFRGQLEALPFPIEGAEAALGVEGTLSKITLVITPKDDMPVDTVANLVALISPEVGLRMAVGDVATQVSKWGDRGVLIMRCFGARDSRAVPGRWLLGILRETLPSLHDLHAIARVEVVAVSSD